jgi:co-chaperonin GroES (HSP10)
MIEPVTHRLVVKPFDVTEHDEVFASAKKSGLVFATDKQLIREQEAVDRGTVVAMGPTVFRDFGSDNPLKLCTPAMVGNGSKTRTRKKFSSF